MDDSRQNPADLVRRIQAGDPSAEEELATCYDRRLKGLARQMLHDTSKDEDVSQETMHVAIKRIRDGEIREPEKLDSFMRGIARHIADKYNEKTRRLGNPDLIEAANEVPSRAPSPLEELLKRERTTIVHRVLEEMKPRDRDILIRYLLDGEDRGSICKRHGLTRAQFNVVFHRAQDRFEESYRKRLAELGEPIPAEHPQRRRKKVK
jgi:RNA polymerase sigma-70 factor (ECF subfamily)